MIVLLLSLAACNAGADPVPTADGGSMPGMDMSGAGMADENGVHVMPEVAEKLGITTEAATSADAELVGRAPATVGWDPLAVGRITAQPGGQIKALLLPRPGEPVRRGEIVARVYQPEIRGAFEELRVARGLGEPWLGGARARLLASGVSAGEIDAALASGTTPDTYAVRAPSAGVVLARDVAEGEWIAAGGQIGVVGSPGALVVEMAVTGPVPALGTRVSLRDPASGERWPATVTSLLAMSDAAGAQVRLATASAPPVGRPLVAEWTQPADSGGAWVPRTALIDTGKRQVVFVEVSPGRYEPRTVTVGARGDGRIQILAGVAEGEAVVVAGTFLLDSESQIGSTGKSGHMSH